MSVKSYKHKVTMATLTKKDTEILNISWNGLFMEYPPELQAWMNVTNVPCSLQCGNCSVTNICMLKTLKNIKSNKANPRRNR